tara:strand:+ start:88 stop:252 length:165 start_codon:yes stop_codon:yes gene_type:complete
MLDEAVKKEIQILSKIELDGTKEIIGFSNFEKFQILTHHCLLEYQLGKFIFLNY